MSKLTNGGSSNYDQQVGDQVKLRTLAKGEAFYWMGRRDHEYVMLGEDSDQPGQDKYCCQRRKDRIVSVFTGDQMELPADRY